MLDDMQPPAELSKIIGLNAPEQLDFAITASVAPRVGGLKRQTYLGWHFRLSSCRQLAKSFDCCFRFAIISAE